MTEHLKKPTTDQSTKVNQVTEFTRPTNPTTSISNVDYSTGDLTTQNVKKSFTKPIRHVTDHLKKPTTDKSTKVNQVTEFIY